MSDATVVYEAKDCLGESILWSPEEQALYWLDLHEPKLHRLHPKEGRHQAWPIEIEPPLGMIVRTARPGVLILACRAGLLLFEVATGRRTPIAHPAEAMDLFYNDGKTDRQGRLWLGTLEPSEKEPRAVFFRFDRAQASVADSGFVVCNGPAFSPAGDVMYVSDSLNHRILAYDVSTGTPHGRRLFAQIEKEDGLPDGITVDSEGCLWVAHWDGWGLARFSPTGERLSFVPMPVPRVTSCAFGGPDLQTLFVTTARLDLSDAELERAPLSGAVFAIDAGVAGIADTPCTLAR